MKRRHRQGTAQDRTQSGVSAMEFALIFPLLFMLVWAMISYSIPFFMYQVMNYATAEGARAALSADPGVNSQGVSNLGTQATTACTLATARLNSALKVLPVRFQQVITSSCTSSTQTASNPASNCISTTGQYQQQVLVTVTLTYPGCSTSRQASCIVPALNLLGASIPNLPAYSTTATALLSCQ